MVSNPADLQDWNGYSYVSNRPMTFNDPSGHFPLGTPGVGGGPFTFSITNEGLSDPDQAINGTPLSNGSYDVSPDTTVRVAVDADGYESAVGVVGSNGQVLDGTANDAAEIVNGARYGDGSGVGDNFQDLSFAVRIAVLL